MKRKLCALLLSLFSLDALAYRDLITQPNGDRATYSIQLSDIVPAATATDVIVIAGSPNKTIRITRIQITGDASSNSIIDLYVYKRFASNTGGTSSLQLPVEHDSLWPLDATITNSGFVVGQTYIVSGVSTTCNSIGSANNTINTVFVATATSTSACIATESANASVRLYTANPSALGYGQLIRGDHYGLASSGTSFPWIEDFGVRNNQEIVLRGASESLAISLNGQAIPNGFDMYVLIEWTEE